MERKFILSTSAVVRQQELNNVEKYLYELDLEHDYDVTITPSEKSRSQLQHNLFYRWAGMWAKATHQEPVEAQGYLKLEILLPFMKTWDRHQLAARRFQWVLDRFPKYEHQIYLAPMHLHTGDLNMREFCDFLDAIQRRGAEQGIQLTSSQDILDAVFKNSVKIGSENIRG